MNKTNGNSKRDFKNGGIHITKEKLETHKERVILAKSVFDG
jgi:hypothetical protein